MKKDLTAMSAPPKAVVDYGLITLFGQRVLWVEEDGSYKERWAVPRWVRDRIEGKDNGK